MPSVRLSRSAMLNILLSVTEPYKHEAWGVVLGKNGGSRIRVANAIPYQTAIRSFNQVSDSQKLNRLAEFLAPLNMVVGDFHSHSDYKNVWTMELSQEDRKSMDKGKIEIIVGVKKYKKRFSLPVETRDDDRKGFSFGLKGYRYHFRCYYKNHQGKIREVTLVPSESFAGIIA